LDADGSLVLSPEPGGIKLSAPVAYQMSGKARTVVACRYVVKGKLVSFLVGNYDRDRKLVIDPKFIFSGLVRTPAQSFSADRDGNLYLAGIDYYGSTTPGAYESPIHSAFVTKRDKNGNTLWTANIGSVNGSAQVCLGVDASGAVYLGGTAYPQYPVTPGAFPNVPAGGPQRYGFVSKLSSDGSTLLKSTLLTSSLFGGDGADAVTALAVSPEGQVTVVGTTFVLRNSFEGVPTQFHQPGGFAARLSEDWTNVVYSRALRTAPSLLGIDDTGNAVFDGVGFETENSPVSLQPGPSDAHFYVGLDSGVTLHLQRGLPVTVGITVDPNSALTMMRATTGGVFQSSDGGLTWRPVELGSPGLSYTGVWIHPKKPLLRFASGFVPFVGTSFLYRSEDGGESWQSVRVLPTFSAFFDVGTRIMAKTPSSNVPYYTIDEGKTCNPLNVFIGASSVCCVVDPSNPRHFLMGSSSFNSGTIETLDGGFSFRGLSLYPYNNNYVMPLAFDPHFPGVLYGYDKGISGPPSGY